MGIMKTRKHGYGFFLLVSIFGALLMNFTFLVTLYFSLHLDEDHRARFFDPFLLSIGFSYDVVVGLVVSPLLFFCLRRKRVAVALPVVFGSVLITVGVLSPFSADFGLCGACIALIISVLCCLMLPNSELN
jgi:hypothetical protein